MLIGVACTGLAVICLNYMLLLGRKETVAT